MSDITKISELRTKDGGDWDKWPYPTVTITSAITGELRKRILAKLEIADNPGTEVTIEESEVSGGYSEYTQENDCSIRVMVDGTEHWQRGDMYGTDGAMAAFMKWSTE